MQSFISSVFSEMSNRVKTPLLGTFVLCWLAYNHDHVAKLMFSDNAQRLVLIDSLSFDWVSDVLMPLTLALAYIFLVPIAQWGIDQGKYWLVDKRRTATLHHHLLDTYRSQERVARQQSKTKLEYWQELHRNNAENAGKKIVQLKDNISHEKARYRELENQLRAAEENYGRLINTNEHLSRELHARAEENLTLTNQLTKNTQALDVFNAEVRDSLKIMISKEFSWMSHGLLSAPIKKCLKEEENMLLELVVAQDNQKLTQQIFDLFMRLRESTDEYFVDLEERCKGVDSMLGHVSHRLASASEIVSMNRD
ncbi:TPA: hypothetical protein RQK75_002279 [Vibrio vulnificus]|nr:hypothetical protein [Vibrio vulnificus]